MHFEKIHSSWATVLPEVSSMGFLANCDNNEVYLRKAEAEAMDAGYAGKLGSSVDLMYFVSRKAITSKREGKPMGKSNHLFYLGGSCH